MPSRLPQGGLPQRELPQRGQTQRRLSQRVRPQGGQTHRSASTSSFLPAILFVLLFLCASLEGWGEGAAAASVSHARAVELENGRISLWWDLSDSMDIQGYRIYAKTAEDLWELIATVPASKQRWQSQTKINGSFSVTVVDKYGVEEKNRNAALNIPYLKISTDNCLTSFIDDQNNLWIGTPGGVKRINIDTNQVKIYTVKDGLINNYVQTIIQDRRGYLWFGTREGLSCYTGKLWKTYTKADGLLSDNVLSIMQDTHKSFWLGTAEGVSRYDGGKWLSYTKADGLSGYAVKGIEKDKKGDIWFATSDGISRYDGKEWTTYSKDFGLASNDILCIHKDKTGRLWFGTNYGGVSIYNGKEWFVYANSEISHTPVRSIVEDVNANLWFATSEKVVRFDGYNWKSYGVDDGLASPDISSLSMDKAGRIWAVGTCILNKNCGISRYNGKIWQTWTQGVINPLNLSIKHGLSLWIIPVLVLIFSCFILSLCKKKIMSAYANITMIKTRNLLKRILTNPEIFFAVIYEILPGDKYPLSTLNHLSVMLRVKHQFAALLCRAYYHLQKAINEESDGRSGKVTEVLNQGLLARTAEALYHTTHFKWGEEIYAVYLFLSRAWEAENFSQILKVEETLKETTTLLQKAAQEFIIPEVVGIIDRLEDEFFAAINRYQRARITKKKMEHLQLAIEVLVELQESLKEAEAGRQKSTDKITVQPPPALQPSIFSLQPTQPETVFLQKILANWALRVKDYIQIVNSRAQLEYQLKNRNLLHTSSGLLVFELTNTGGGPARNIRLKLVPGNGYRAVPESRQEVNLLLPQRTIEVELRIQVNSAVSKHSIVAEVLLQFDDLEKSGKEIRISEKINLFSINKHDEVRELIPNPYAVERPLQMGLLSREDTIRLITQPVADYFQYDPLAAERIFKVTAGHPYFVRLLCHEAVNYRNKAKKNYVTRADINDVVNTLIENNVLPVDFIWRELSLDNQIFLSMLAAILNSNEDSSIKGIEDFMVRYNLNLDIKAITTELLKKEIIREEGGGGSDPIAFSPDSGYYRFRMELLPLWINRYKNIQQLSGRVSKYSPLWGSDRV